jgi:hypothetical protein
LARLEVSVVYFQRFIACVKHKACSASDEKDKTLAIRLSRPDRIWEDLGRYWAPKRILPPQGA